MKKRFLFSLVAMAAMVIGTGCSNDELFNDYSQENAIGFDTYIGRGAETRATVIDETKLKEVDFGVFAYYGAQTPNFMYNEKIEWNADSKSWIYSPIKYWPSTQGHTIDFYAYAPYDNDLTGEHDDKDGENNSNITLSANNYSGTPTVTYTVPTDIAQQIDLLYANVKEANGSKTAEKVNFNFKHALSRIGFSVEALYNQVNNQTNGDDDASYGTTGEGESQTEKTDNGSSDENTTIEVKKVVLSGKFIETGTMSLNPTESNGQVTYLWSNRSSNGSSGNIVSYELKREGEIDNFMKTTPEGSSVVDHAVVTNAKKQLNNADSYIMIIPNKDENAEEKIENITVTVEYEVSTKDDKLDGGYSTVQNTVTSEPFSLNFKAGKAYNFVLHIGLTSVQFSANVTDWDEANSDVVVNVPLTGSTPAQGDDESGDGTTEEENAGGDESGNE